MQVMLPLCHYATIMGQAIMNIALSMLPIIIAIIALPLTTQ